MFFKKNTVPVFLTGMWPSRNECAESGARVAIIEKEGGPILLEGFADSNGEYRAALAKNWVGKQVFVVVREPGFQYNYFNPVRVEKWGFFLAIFQEKDLVYAGVNGENIDDPERWRNWDSTQEHIKASEKTANAVRRAKLAWPIEWVGIVLSLILGGLGFIVQPFLGIFVGLLAYALVEYLSNYLRNSGY